MRSVIDLEAQQVTQAAPRTEVEGAETNEKNIFGLHTNSVASPQRPVFTGQGINDEAQPLISRAEGYGASSVPEMNIRRSFSSDDVSYTTCDSDMLAQTESQAHLARNPTFEAGPRNTTSDQQPKKLPEEPRMIGDFDGSSSEFWKLFRDEAKSHDEARINTLKDGMESALIFAGFFAGTLRTFLVDSMQNLKPSPTEETIYYLRQHSAILSQISVQLSSIAPQVAIPSTPPPPFPPFSPSASDVRLNVFWFMALAFSLLAGFLSILVQQWVRNYMHVFERYDDPLKSSRLRQYLYEGCERWNMPNVAEAVPGLLHVSLFLFFIGLGDSLLDLNTKVALGTMIPIGISGLLYIFTIFTPLIYPQSPYHNLYSRVLWYLTQKLRWRRFRDRGSVGEMKPVSANMAKGQLQLAMEETEARKGRDERAIRWLIDKLTEDAEMEKFLSAIPGSFNTDWGTEVWKRVGKRQECEDQGQNEPVARPHGDTTAHQPSSSWSIHSVLRLRKPTTRHPRTHATTYSPVPHTPNVHRHSPTALIRDSAVHELSTRVARSVEICKNRKLFSNNDGQWRKRTRACIEATVSLVCCTNAKLSWFGGISKLLGDIGSSEMIRELSLEGTDELFVKRWTCLSLVAIRPILADDRNMRNWIGQAMESFARADDTGNKDALAAAQKIDETVKKARDCLSKLSHALHRTEDLTEEVEKILRGHESQISELEQINIEASRFGRVDSGLFNIQDAINHHSHQIISQFPGVLDDYDLYWAPIPFNRLVELSRNLCRLQFIRPRQILKSMCSPSLTLRKILQGQGDADAYKELLKNLEFFNFWPGWEGDEMQRQLWRVQDFSDGGGLGFTVELFFLAFEQLLSTSSSTESHSALYTGAFQAITSDWSKHKHSLGTQKILLDIAMSRRWAFDAQYPAYIVDKFLLLLRNVFEGQTGPHIDIARQQFESFDLYGPRRYRERVLAVLAWANLSAKSLTL